MKRMHRIIAWMVYRLNDLVDWIGDVTAGWSLSLTSIANYHSGEGYEAETPKEQAGAQSKRFRAA